MARRSIIPETRRSVARRRDRDDGRSVWQAKIRGSGHFLELAPEALRTDRDFILRVVRETRDAFRYAGEAFRDDKDVALAAMQLHGGNLYLASPRLRADRDVVLAAVTTYGKALDYAPEHLREDEEILLAAIERGGLLEHHGLFTEYGKEFRAWAKQRAGDAEGVTWTELHARFAAAPVVPGHPDLRSFPCLGWLMRRELSDED